MESFLDYEDVRTGRKANLPFALSPYARVLGNCLIDEPSNNETRALLTSYLNDTGESFAGIAIKGKGTVKCVAGIPTEIVCRASDWFRKPTSSGYSMARAVCELLPVTVVTLHGVEAKEIAGIDTYWRGDAWKDKRMWQSGNIPDEWFDMIANTFPGEAKLSREQRTDDHITLWGYEPQKSILSITALNAGRRRAGLELIKPEGKPCKTTL